jgi:predicted Zn-dependent protease
MALLGAIALRRGQARSAWRWLEEAAAVDPGSALVRLKRAEYWLALGVTDRALAELEEAAEGLEPHSPLWPQLRQALAAVEGRRRREVSRSPALPSLKPLLPRLGAGRRKSGVQPWR